MVNNSIEKLNEQINILQNNIFVEKEKTDTIKLPIKNRKVILEETTVCDTLLGDLVGDNEATKVFGNRELSLTDTNTKLLETITIGAITFNQKKVMDIYLPIFLGLLIFMFIIFIIMI
ncbi:MAG: hypothetical protein Q4E69_05165 [Bacilli bacterium]|nr:hypothetical protein [Bacilli bacterium]